MRIRDRRAQERAEALADFLAGAAERHPRGVLDRAVTDWIYAVEFETRFMAERRRTLGLGPTDDPLAESPQMLARILARKLKERH